MKPLSAYRSQHAFRKGGKDEGTMDRAGTKANKMAIISVLHSIPELKRLDAIPQLKRQYAIPQISGGGD